MISVHTMPEKFAKVTKAIYNPTSHWTQDQTQEHIHDRRPVHSGDFQKQEKQSHLEAGAQNASVSDIPGKHQRFR